LSTICLCLGITIIDLASDLLYFSHDTFTAKCKEAEYHILKEVFAEALSNIIICNTKYITGHAFSTSFEDPIAVESLLQQRIPPIHNPPHDRFSELQLSKGGSHTRKYALHFATAFGSTNAFAFYQLHCKYV